MTEVVVNGLRTHVARMDAPGAPTAVLIHGLGADSLASWYFTLARPLRDTGLAVLMYDLRGHGRTERPPTGYHLDTFVDDLEALLAAMGVDGTVYLFGNSFGGTIAFAYAMRHPERVAGIVAIESAPPVDEWLGMLTRRLGGQCGTPGKPVVRAAARQLATATTIVADLTGSVLPDPGLLGCVTCPVLCVYGGDSRLVGLAGIAGRLVPHADLAVVAGQRHTVLVDQPASVRHLVLPWVDRARAIAHR
jgi:pimeloyl-ACP methyl ester carboxylesterase